jgi:hypothetical protein
VPASLVMQEATLFSSCIGSQPSNDRVTDAIDTSKGSGAVTTGGVGLLLGAILEAEEPRALHND